MDYTLDFEKPISVLENQIKELKETEASVDMSAEITALQTKVDKLLNEIYTGLTSWQRVQLSRHPMRPHAIDYIQALFTDFQELAGDRYFSNDRAMITGFGHLGKQKVCVIGIEKGRKTNEKIERNFGMANPEGYRKALRIMRLASQFNIPIITFVDTPGAYPGIGAEERGQAQAIAENIMEMFDLDSPVISVIIGEGGSGGALGIAVADQVAMLEYSVYSVISPESCASILWSDPKKAEVAANSLQLTPEKAKELGIIDSIVNEPTGGAHRNSKKMYTDLKEFLLKQIEILQNIDLEELKSQRHQKFRIMGNNTIEGITASDGHCMTEESL